MLPDRLAAASRWMPVGGGNMMHGMQGMSSDVRSASVLGAPDCWAAAGSRRRLRAVGNGMQGMSSDAGGAFVPEPRLPGQQQLETQAVQYAYRYAA
jgi:hypothetical protein